MNEAQLEASEQRQRRQTADSEGLNTRRQQPKRCDSRPSEQRCPVESEGSSSAASKEELNNQRVAAEGDEGKKGFARRLDAPCLCSARSRKCEKAD